MCITDNTYLYGAGGHGKVIKEIIEANGGKVEAFIDDKLDVCQHIGLSVLHSAKDCSSVFVSVGDNHDRRKIVERLHNVVFPTFIHPSAIVSPSAKIGKGTVVMPGAIINADAVIGDHCIVNTGASVGHDCIVDDFCHIAPHATLCGNAHLCQGVWFGAGAVINQGLSIGQWSVVGSGTVVIDDIAENEKVVGVPAMKI